MTTIYFVRHAQPEHEWTIDRTRPLTAEAKEDAKAVLGFFKDKCIDAFYCSPYKRSVDTIAETAAYFQLPIITDERLREREKGPNGNVHGLFEKRWQDLDFHEEGGESIHSVQKRNIAALEEILRANEGKVIVIGTHGTALSSMINYYVPTFGCKDFLRLIDWMPYIVEIQFVGLKMKEMIEHLHIQKEFKGNKRADK